MYKFRMFEEQGISISMIYNSMSDEGELWTFKVYKGRILKCEGGYYDCFENAEVAALKKAIEYL